MKMNLSRWNGIIDDVNAVITNPPSGCTALDPIPHVENRTVWAKSHFHAIYNAIAATCDSIAFEADLSLSGRESWISEIYARLGEAWCECECDPCPEGTNGDVTIMDWIRPVVRRDMVLNTGNACQPTPFDNTIFDWRSIVNALTNAPGHRGNAIVQYQTIRNGLVIFSRQIGSVEFACDGSVKTPIPPTASPNVWDVLGTELYDTACSEICDTPFGPIPCCLGAIACGSDDDAAQKSEADALAAAAPVIHDHWYVHRTCFGSCRECCDDGRGFKGLDCPA